MGDLLKGSQTYAKKALREQWEKEKKSFRSKKSKNQPLGDKDDPVDEIVRVAASFIGTVSEAYQYRKEKKQAAKGTGTAQREEANKQEDGVAVPEQHRATDGQVLPQQNRPSSSEDLVISTEDAHGGDSPFMSPAEDFSEAAWRADEERRRSSVDSTPQAGHDTTTSTEGIASKTNANEENKNKPSDFAKNFIERHPFSPAAAGDRARIELPVVIPQRRPKKRGRGFVRAYSPVLADAGIQQPEFLDFVDSFNRALVPSEWIHAIELISSAGTAAPEPIAILLDQALEMAVQAATEAQSRYRGGRFIDRVNAEYFIPRGLVAMVVTWKSWDDEKPGEPNQSTALEGQTSQPSRVQQTLDGGVSFRGPEIGVRERTLDPATGFTRSWHEVRSRKATPVEVRARLTSHMQQRMKRYHGVFECPETAPLVFPSAAEDYEVMVTKPNGKRMNGFDRGEQWINGFRDRRAQTKWNAKTPASQASATAQKHRFRSRYADPSHPAASGDVVAFATGGKWSTRGKVKQPGQEQEQDNRDEGVSSGEERAEQKWLRKKCKEDLKRREKARKKAEREEKGGSGLGNLLRTDVLYLVIMNLPSAEKRAVASGKCAATETRG
ncbi:hypothetical protein NLU13_1610 [Sarocladium strictum]|uniref:Uncharacterized protein n=1 Tax=Sarocladium strictum TaxID=5046 RepID=A0AA39GU35_SARSR|nr:hypothetical protein NLU13_1610 [Sarocladium strictum]